MIFSVTIYTNIYVVKMSDDEAVDIAVAWQMSCIYIFGKLQKPRKSDIGYCCYGSFSGSN